jgi:hypothetical protein
MLIGGLGFGLFVPTLIDLVLAGASEQRAGTASGALTSCSKVGGAPPSPERRYCSSPHHDRCADLDEVITPPPAFVDRARCHGFGAGAGDRACDGNRSTTRVPLEEVRTGGALTWQLAESHIR